VRILVLDVINLLDTDDKSEQDDISDKDLKTLIKTIDALK
jgi:hypothetical protein